MFLTLSPSIGLKLQAPCGEKFSFCSSLLSLTHSRRTGQTNGGAESENYPFGFSLRLQIDIILRGGWDCLANRWLKWLSSVLSKSLSPSVQYLSLYHADDGFLFDFFVVLLVGVWGLFFKNKIKWAF